MKGQKRFQSAVVKVMARKLRPFVDEHGSELADMMRSQLLDLPGPTRILRTQTKEEVFMVRVFRGFAETNASSESLKNFELYVARTPFPEAKVSKLSYLQFVIESYLNEVYILSERLHSYLAVLQRAYRRSERAHVVTKIVEALDESVSATFKGINSARGAHVHVSRYSDSSIDKLKLLEMLFAGKRDPKFVRLYQLQFRISRSEWAKAIRKNNKTIDDFLDILFESLFNMIFTKESKIMFPWD